MNIGVKMTWENGTVCRARDDVSVWSCHGGRERVKRCGGSRGGGCSVLD